MNLSKPPQSPACPKCGGEMKPKQKRHASISDPWFWSCAIWPVCDGTRPGDRNDQPKGRTYDRGDD